MRKMLLALAALAIGGTLVAAQAASSASPKVAICHKTSSKTKPYQRITVAPSAVAGFAKKAEDIIPAPKTCPNSLLTPTSGGVGFLQTMYGVAEQPDPADPDGTGTVALQLRSGQGQVCFSLAAREIKLPASGAHIHQGAVDASGPVMVNLTPPTADGVASTGCVAADRKVVADILANPSSYYVNVHTSDYPDGAIRAQLQRPTAIALMTSPMTGAQEKPAAADPNGIGMGVFLLSPDKGKLCYTLAVKNILLPATGAHIHRGDGNTAGPVIIPFTAPNATGASEGCVTVDGALLKEIMGNPVAFYANVHSTQFPGGAVRSQLTLVQ